jgi:hypothetical protein
LRVIPWHLCYNTNNTHDINIKIHNSNNKNK